MTIAAYGRFTEAGIKKIAARKFDRKDHLARQAALEDVKRKLATIEKIAEQENIAKQTTKLVEAAANRLARSKGSVTSYRTIEKRLCKVFRVTSADIAGRGRNSPPIVLARQAVMYWAKRLTRMSPQEIGHRMGGRDHSTIYHGIDAYPAKRAKQDRTLRRLPRLSEFKGRKR